MKIFEIPQKLRVEWLDDVKAILDTWTTYNVSLSEFKNAVLVEGLNHAKANGGLAWIVDSSSAKGAFTPEIHKFIETDVFKSFANNGIKYFITINSNVSAITKLNVKQYSSIAGPHGVKLIELQTADDAIMWLKENVFVEN